MMVDQNPLFFEEMNNYRGLVRYGNMYVFQMLYLSRALTSVE